jgi:hypothetical protein
MAPETENAPAVGTGASTSGSEGDWSNREEARQATVAEVIAHHERVSAYLLPVINAAGRVPELGSPEWCQASESARHAVVFVYAKRYLDHVGIRAWGNVDKARIAEEERLTAQREASHAVSAAFDWTKQAGRPSFAVMRRRRSVIT